MSISINYGQRQEDLRELTTLGGKTLTEEDLIEAMEALVRIQFAYRYVQNTSCMTHDQFLENYRGSRIYRCKK